MADKEIIIDGVDVSKCGYFQSSCIPDYSGGYLYKNICRNHGFYDCDKKPCAFKCTEYQKQLKRKEQECEKLNSDNCYFVYKIISLEILTDEYEQALNKIRQYRVAEIDDEDKEENDTILTIINEVKETNNNS